MPTSLKTLGETVWDLPPLILHPFNERVPGVSTFSPRFVLIRLPPAEIRGPQSESVYIEFY